MVALYAQRKAWDIGEVRVDVEYDYESVPRRFDVTVHLPEGLRQDQIDRLKRVADACPVRRALEAGFAFGERISSPDPVVPSARP